MNKEINSHQFPEVYEVLNIDLCKLGCVMIDIEQKLYANDLIPMSIFDIQGFMTHFEECLYFAKNKERFWIDGWVANKTLHLTLLYGLIEEARRYARHIDRVLKDWKFEEVEIEEIGYFDSPYDDEEYYCIVAHIKKTPELLEGHKRLSLLPHINTFSEYNPHLTIAYIKKIDWIRDSIIADLKKELIGTKLKIKPEINLGGNKTI